MRKISNFIAVLGLIIGIFLSSFGFKPIVQSVESPPTYIEIEKPTENGTFVSTNQVEFFDEIVNLEETIVYGKVEPKVEFEFIQIPYPQEVYINRYLRYMDPKESIQKLTTLESVKPVNISDKQISLD